MIIPPGQEEHVEQDVWETLENELRAEHEQCRRELNEINLMLEQSQLEANKLAQRNASISAHLQQVQAQFETMPRADIRMAYDSALDAQQRLFVMRGQRDKLQSDRTHIERNLKTVERILTLIGSGARQNLSQKGASSAWETVEMIIQAQESERQRLARQMHDEPAQALSNFILQTEIAMRLFDVDQAKAREELSNLKVAATNTFQKVRDFIFDLRPMMLDDLGLPPTLNRYIDAFKEQSGTDIRLTVSGLDQRLESYLEVMIFRAIQELVGNAVRHSQASLIKVQVDSNEREVKVSVDDNGKGFDIETALNHGRGIKLIRERVELLGGEVDIESLTGQGTRITFRIPARKTKIFA